MIPLSRAVRPLAALAPIALAAACAAGRPAEEKPLYAPPRPVPALDGTEEAEAQEEAARARREEEERRRASAPADGAARELVVGEVQGEPIYARELLRHLFFRDSQLVWGTMENLVLAYVAAMEAQRLGLTQPPPTLEEAFERDRKDLEGRVARMKTGRTTEEFLREVLRMNPERYWARLREQVLMREIRVRVARAFALEKGYHIVRVLRVETAEEAAAVKAELDAGRDFVELVEERSGEDAESGGLLPFPLLRIEGFPLSQVADAVGVGEVAGPVEELGAFLFLRVEERVDGESGGWERLGPAVEESLEALPVRENELLQWFSFMERRYTIDLSSFLRALGEAPAESAGAAPDPEAQ